MNKKTYNGQYLNAYILYGIGRYFFPTFILISTIPLLYILTRYIISIYKKEGIINWKDWVKWIFFTSIIAFDIVYTYIIN